MTDQAPAQGFWRSARQLPSRTPLRVKLIAAVLALVTAALVVISIAGIAFMRGYLLNQADDQLRATAYNANVSAIVNSYLSFGRGSAQPAYGGVSIQWLPANGKLQQVVAEASGYRAGQPHLVSGPSISRQDTWLERPGRTSSEPSWLNINGSPISPPVTVSAINGDGRWRVVSTTFEFLDPPNSPVSGTIILGVDVTRAYQTLNELTIIDLIVSGVLLVVLAAVGIAVIRSSMRPLQDIERTAEAIAGGDLGRRVPERDPRTEVGRLGRSLNTMLAHIETAFRARMASEEAARRSEEAANRAALAAGRSEDRMRQFVADASHELRTPLTAIRGFAEYYRQRGGVAMSDEPGADGQAVNDAAVNGTAAVRSDEPVRAGSGEGNDNGHLPTGPMNTAELDRLIQRVEGETSTGGSFRNLPFTRVTRTIHFL